ncbi:hypothetical protein ASPVEDRAFT_878854 [Aspergillus versicolor CBS 583.65]|uniref:Uncharacterized protein n=1 Tax=Aspergillus versicolor CBS 583.65 TaxID=1036611 RepID=A0A1L9Q3J5_ASPVE|nr:uncharacterized protein ASPVEDRAFT_878854 [Aspergillus versicolor CBS 583.65]OJJ08330.1 hypothetical protein ASPVEDRAFT_878854 [Aspergillus versicolor CBS 583.65]
MDEVFSATGEQICDDASIPSYQCSHCQRRFARVDHLSRHVRTHTHEKPFACGVCGKAFSRNDLLKRHECRHASRRRIHQAKSPSGLARRVSQACRACAVSKVKCDDAKPCARCVKKNVLCDYDWNASVESSELDQQDSMEDVLLDSQPRAAQAPIDPAIDSSLGLSAPAGPARPRTTNIWDQHLNIDQTFDELLNLPMPDFMSPAEEAGPSASLAGLDCSGTRQKTSFEERAFAAGARAFEGSWLNWSPDSMHQPSIDQDEANLSLPHDWTKDKDSLRRDPSFTQQPLSIADRERVLSTLLLFSDRRPLIRIATTFPGTQEMESLLHGFLRHQLADTLSWFHVPTFSLSRLRDELLAALVAFGATLAHVEVIQKLGHAMADILRYSVIEQWRRDNSLSRDLQLMQALHTITFLGVYSGDRCKMEIAESTSQPLITVLRRARWLLSDHYVSILPSSEDDDAANQRKWEAWVEQESVKRLVYQVFVLDANISMLNLTTPVMHFDEMHVPMPETDELWFAASASEWRTRYLSRPRLSSQPTLCENVLRLLTDRDLVLGDDPLGSSLYVLHGMWRVIWEHRRLQDLVTLALEDCPVTESVPSSVGGGQRLAKALTKMSVRIPETQNSAGIKMSEFVFLLEFLSMTLHVPINCLQAFAGKDGPKEAQRVCCLLQEWTPTKEARQAMWHGGQLIRAARQLPAERMQDIKVAIVYQTSLAFWAYGTVHIARRKREGCATPTLSDATQLTKKPLVALDGVLTSEVRRFISLDEGTPYISDSNCQDGDYVDENRVKLLLRPSETMAGTIRVLRPHRQGSYPPLAESFTRLMSEIGRAAKAIGM